MEPDDGDDKVEATEELEEGISQDLVEEGHEERIPSDPTASPSKEVRSLPWLRRGVLTASVLEIEVDNADQVNLQGGMRLRLCLMEPRLDSRWTSSGPRPMAMGREGEENLVAQGTGTAMEPIHGLLSCACIGAPLLVASVVVDAPVEAEEDEGDCQHREDEEEDEGEATMTTRVVVCTGKLPTDILRDPFELWEAARREVNDLEALLAGKMEEAEEDSKNSGLQGEVAGIQAQIEAARQTANPPTEERWIPLRNSAGDELCRLLISLTLSHDPAPAPHPHANLAEADDAEPAERPPMCPLPVEEALGCSLGSLEAALELAMALVVAREASKGARCLASRMSIASMDLLISLSTCLPDASPLPDASWLPDAEPPMPLPDILSRGTVPVRLSKIPPRDPLPPPSCLSALVSTGRIVLRSPGGDRRANIELPTSIATPPPR